MRKNGIVYTNYSESNSQSIDVLFPQPSKHGRFVSKDILKCSSIKPKLKKFDKVDKEGQRSINSF